MPTTDIAATPPRSATIAAPRNHDSPRSVDDTTAVQIGAGIGGHPGRVVE